MTANNLIGRSYFVTLLFVSLKYNQNYSGFDDVANEILKYASCFPGLVQEIWTIDIWLS